MKNVVKVLVVDDDRASNQALCEVIRRMGLKPISAHSPHEALNIVRLQTVHAALVDVLLPKMSGVELAIEFRRTKFADNPIVLVSGVFKDRSFAADAIQKTQAVNFLYKPWNVDELMAALQSALKSLMEAEKWTVQSLLTRKLVSARQRERAVERLDEIRGLDFPFILSLLLEGKISGNLNIVDGSGEIFGVYLSHGAIVDVDSADAKGTTILALIAGGFLAQEDWDHYEKTSSGRVSLEALVANGFVSPHAIAVAKHEQIIHDFRAICSSDKLRLNFVPTDDEVDRPRHAVELGELLTVYLFNMTDFFPAEYLRQFYEPVLDYPLSLRQANIEEGSIWSLPSFQPISECRHLFEKGASLKMMLEQFPNHIDLVYQCLHFCVLNGWVSLNDTVHGKNLDEMLKRYETLYSELSVKTPDEIFAYFGAARSAGPTTLDAILSEYIRSNNPNQFSKEESSQLFELSEKCLGLVRQAHEVLTDETKRAEFYAQKKLQESENLRESNALTAEGLDLLRRGQFQAALDKLKVAESKWPTTLQFLIQIWAEIKVGMDRPRAQELLLRVEKLSMDDRRTPYYFMALGLLKKTLGDQLAVQYFEKALALDPQFVEARRELSARGVDKKPEKVDFLTGDITAVVSQLFRRKAD